MLSQVRGHDSHLVSQGCQVSLKALMFSLQCLHAGQVVPIIVRVQSLVLLLDPLLGLVSIPVVKQKSPTPSSRLWISRPELLDVWGPASAPVEPLHLMGTAQQVGPVLHQLLKGSPAVIHLLASTTHQSPVRDPHCCVGSQSDKTSDTLAISQHWHCHKNNLTKYNWTHFFINIKLFS